MVLAFRIIALAAGAALLTACTSTNSGEQLEQTAAAVTPASFSEGRVPDYCPQITLREGTAILRKQAGEQLSYVSSIASTTRECRIVDGQLRMRIGVAGRLVPGPAATAGPVELPIRIAIVRGADVLYSELGRQQVAVDPAAGASQFVFIDEEIAIPEPQRRDLVIYAGFDEGPPTG